MTTRISTRRRRHGNYFARLNKSYARRLHYQADKKGSLETKSCRREPMKTMILSLAAVLGIAIATTALAPAAQASRVYEFTPADNGQG
jgi:hypothetical protein